MAIEGNERVPKSEGSSAPTAWRKTKFGRTSQNPPQRGKLVDRGTDFGDTANDEVEAYWPAYEVRPFNKQLQSEWSANKEEMATFAVVDEKVNGARQIPYKECIL